MKVWEWCSVSLCVCVSKPLYLYLIVSVFCLFERWQVLVCARVCVGLRVKGGSQRFCGGGCFERRRREGGGGATLLYREMDRMD